ncbi:hypothetical protein KCU95_g15163, partial [Aureobasidium melanogenum]
MKRRLDRLEDHLNREVNSAKKSEDRIFKLEDVSRMTTNAVELATKNHKSLYEQTSKDRLSYRERFSTLEVEMDKNKTRNKETGHAIDGIRSLLDNHIDKSKITHQEQSQNINLCRSKIEEIQHKLDVEIESKLRDNSEILTATRKEMKELKEHPALLSHPPVLCAPAAPASISIDPVEVESRLKAVEQRVQILDEGAWKKDMLFAGELDTLRSNLGNLQVKLEKMQDNNGVEISGKKGLTEEELRNFTAWKDLKSRVEGLASNVNDLSANTTRLEELTSGTKSDLESLINEVKQMTLQGISESSKPQLEYLSKTVENHIDLLQRHELRLNSVTTDEVCKMMENQWRTMYGVPTELRGLVQRQKNLESLTMRSCDDLNKKVSEMNMKYEGMAMEFRNPIQHPSSQPIATLLSQAHPRTAPACPRIAYFRCVFPIAQSPLSSSDGRASTASFTSLIPFLRPLQPLPPQRRSHFEKLAQALRPFPPSIPSARLLPRQRHSHLQKLAQAPRPPRCHIAKHRLFHTVSAMGWPGEDGPPDGVDGEPIDQVGSLRFHHYAPTMEAIESVYITSSTTTTNEQYACFLKLDHATFDVLKSEILELLRRPTGISSKSSAKRESQRATGISAMLGGEGQKTQTVMSKIVSIFEARHPEMFTEPKTEAEIEADYTPNQYGRMDRAPSMYRHVFTERLFRSFADEMKGYPELRDRLTEDGKGRNDQWGPKHPNKVRKTMS